MRRATHSGVVFSLITFFVFAMYMFSLFGPVRFLRCRFYSARGETFSERGLDEVSAIHGDPRLPTLGPGHLGPCSRDVLTVRLLKSTTTSTHYIVAR